MLVLALALGVVIGLPQGLPAVRYYPQSIRARKTAAEKQAIGSVPMWNLMWGGLWPFKNDLVDGVFYPECCWFVGWPALLLVCVWPSAFWCSIALLSALLALGRHTPCFRWSSRLHLRIPARYTYFMSISLAMSSVWALSMAERLFTPTMMAMWCLAQSLSLIHLTSRLWPMHPYVQRWERPSAAFDNALTRFLSAAPQGRVSGLSYPLRTGQINHIHTLGYNGGSQPRWMAAFRQDANPNGSGGHDWFAGENQSSLDMDWYGVRYAYTYRPLPLPRWKPTPIAHLYENTQCYEGDARTWEEVARRYASRPDRQPV